MHALRFGHPDALGSPVVLLHGQPGHASVWRQVGDLLATRGHYALAVDRPGYGHTGGPATGFAENARAVLDFLDHHGIDRATIVTHSWASGIALALATMAPERLDGMVLLAPVGAPESVTLLDHLLAVPVLGWGLLRGGLRMGAWALDRDRLRRFLPAGFGDLDPIEAKRMAGSARSSGARRSAASEQRALVSELSSVREGAADIDTPTVIVSGLRDRIVTTVAARSLADRIEGARVHLVEAGHLLPSEAPGAVAKAVEHVSGRAGLQLDDRAIGSFSDPREPVPARSCSSSSGP
ncbi:MAG: alpha/beta fold hydrolase [Acidimicrobiales bacterium]